MYTYFIVAIFILILVMQNKSRGMKQSIEKLVRQSARYATAAQQDKSPVIAVLHANCLLYTSPSPRDGLLSRMPSSA